MPCNRLQGSLRLAIGGRGDECRRTLDNSRYRGSAAAGGWAIIAGLWAEFQRRSQGVPAASRHLGAPHRQRAALHSPDATAAFGIPRGCRSTDIALLRDGATPQCARFGWGGYMRNIDWPAAWIWTALAVAVILGITTWTMWAPQRHS
jgi:hypothetical protein